MDDDGASNPTRDDGMAWVDERMLGRYIEKKYGRRAEGVQVHLLRYLIEHGHEGLELHRHERFNAAGERIGPDLKMPLQSAVLFLDLVDAAARAIAKLLDERSDGIEPKPTTSRMMAVLDLMLEAGCEAPASE